MDIHLVIQITPVEDKRRSRILIKAYQNNPVVFGEGYAILRQEIDVNQPSEFLSTQTYVLDTLAKVCHEIANDVEEAGYTAIGDLMLKLSEHK